MSDLSNLVETETPQTLTRSVLSIVMVGSSFLEGLYNGYNGPENYEIPKFTLATTGIRVFIPRYFKNYEYTRETDITSPLSISAYSHIAGYIAGVLVKDLGN